MMSRLRYQWSRVCWLWFQWCHRHELRWMRARREAEFRKPGIEFSVGDRVQFVNSRLMDDCGGYGEIIDAHCPNVDDESVVGVLVQFDSMPNFPLWCGRGELQYDRRGMK